jgi:predicted PurR-regulated permease PerM
MPLPDELRVDRYPDAGEDMTHSLRETRWRLTAIAVASAALVAVLAFHLTIALVAAMLVYTGGRRLTDWMERRTHLPYPAIWSVIIVIALIAVTGGFIVERAAKAAATGGLVAQMAAALDQLRTMLPDWVADNLPVTLDELRTATVAWLRENAGQVQLWGQNTLRGATYAIFGVIIGALAVVQTRPSKAGNPPPTSWLSALTQRFALFEQSFGAVVFAQLRIATVNTVLTGIYLLGVLPAIDAPLPLAATLVVFTFVTSLLPVIGNLVSNTVIVAISLTHGLGIALLSLGFLVAIHKLEYLLNAHIVGTSIGTKAFELLAVMLFFEAIFGLPGLVMAPIIYAYAKAELRAVGWL